MLKFSSVFFAIKDKQIINNISFTINPGDFVVILGHNGAGKSTLFDLISGRKTPTSGSIFYKEKDITNLNDIDRASFIARLYQNPTDNVVNTMTVKQNLSISLYKNHMCTLKSGEAMFNSALFEPLSELFFDLETILETKMSDLSGGQKQTIASFMTTTHTPEILLLDEPTAALDPQSATKVLQFLNKQIQTKKITTFLITHDPYLAINLGNKIWILQDGMLVNQIDKTKEEKIDPEQLIGSISYNQL